MKKYTLFTEDLGNLGSLVSKYFDGFTLTETKGSWKGRYEKSVRIEILNSKNEDLAVYTLVDEIKRKNNQEAVLLEVTEIDARFI